MRRLRAAEVAVLVAGMAIGSDNVHADETPPPEDMATVTVTGTRLPQLDFLYLFVVPTSVNPGQAPPQNGYNTASLTQSISHAMNCANAYGYIPQLAGGSWAQPKAGWQTFFVNNYAYTNYNGLAFYVSPSSTHPSAPPPGGGSWYNVDGVSVRNPDSSNPYVLGNTSIYLHAFTSNYNLIDTFAHEWAHQWGLQDNGSGNPLNDATAYGNAVAAAYKADSGKKCGGL